MRPRDLRRLALCGALLALAGCGPTGAYVWVNDVPKTDLAGAGDGAYVIGAGDLLSVRVYNQEAISTRGRVRPDGRIAVPLAGEIEAVGRRPVDLAKEIEAHLKSFVVAPVVAVSVEEIQPVKISVLGEVARPGMFTLEAGAGVLEALASAGGPTDFADKDAIFVLRRRGAAPPLRVRFTYAQLTGGAGNAAAFTLVSGDVVTVE